MTLPWSLQGPNLAAARGLVFVDCQLGQEEGKMKGSTKSAEMDEPIKCRDDTRRLGYVLFESGATGA
jgi:hypothetical protein